MSPSLKILVLLGTIGLLALTSARGQGPGSFAGVKYKLTSAGGVWQGWFWSTEDNAWAQVDEARGSFEEARGELARFVAWYTLGDGALASMRALQAELMLAGVRHFTAPELVTIRHPAIARSVGITTAWFDAPATVRNQLTQTALLADKLRDLVGAPLTVRNGYRPDVYNDAVSEALDSQHELGRALDLAAEDMPKLRRMLKRLYTKGQVSGARYYATNIHLDRRLGSRHEGGTHVP